MFAQIHSTPQIQSIPQYHQSSALPQFGMMQTVKPLDIFIHPQSSMQTGFQEPQMHLASGSVNLNSIKPLSLEQALLNARTAQNPVVRENASAFKSSFHMNQFDNLSCDFVQEPSISQDLYVPVANNQAQKMPPKKPCLELMSCEESLKMYDTGQEQKSPALSETAQPSLSAKTDHAASMNALKEVAVDQTKQVEFSTLPAKVPVSIGLGRPPKNKKNQKPASPAAKKKVNLNNLSTVDKDKTYKCRVCDRGFKRIAHLNRHDRSHTGAKPYKCNICLLKVSRSDNLRQHIVKVHGQTFARVQGPNRMQFCIQSNYKKFYKKLL